LLPFHSHAYNFSLVLLQFEIHRLYLCWTILNKPAGMVE
jgi:hypothetical protein